MVGATFIHVSHNQPLMAAPGHLSRWSQVAEEERYNKTLRQLQKTRVIFVHFKRMTAFKQNTWKKTLEILEQLQERLETVWLERRAITAPLSSTDPPPNSVIEAKTYTEWGLFI